MKIRTSLAAVVAALAVVACGGSSDSGSSPITIIPPPTSVVPPSASASVTGFITYLQQLVVQFADLLEPVDTSSVTGPTDETSEPTKVD